MVEKIIKNLGDLRNNRLQILPDKYHKTKNIILEQELG